MSATKWDSRYSGPIPHDTKYYLNSMLGGVLACGLTHAAITPIDVTKCNMQVNPQKYKGMFSGLRTLLAEEGAQGIWKGFGPTLAGYSAQGCFKYGLYEVFKDQYANLAGKETFEKYKPLIWVSASASAEVFADIALCPFEMTKVKIQTSPKGEFPVAFGAALKQMSATRADTRYPFGSLTALWSRQIPYTMAKFYCFEKIVSLFYTHVYTAPKSSYSKPTQLGITFASGYLAGIICAIVSHPADTLVSLMGKPANKGKGAGQIINELGMVQLCTKGLGVRVIMIGTLTGFQWWIYDTFKSAMGMGTSGGK